MSTVKTNNVQIGQSLTASQNFTLYQPASPDGTVRLGNGNAGSVTDLVTLTSAGNLGIGGSPASNGKLVIVGTAATGLTSFASIGTTTAYNQQFVSNTGGSIYWGVENSSGGAIFSGSSAYASVLGSGGSTALQFGTNSSIKATLDASGNLGLGVTPQTWSTGKAISVGYSGSSIWSATESGNIFMLSNAYYNGGYKYDISGKAASYYQQNSGVHSWYTAASGTAGNAITFNQAMTLDASGNLLVGSTSINGSTSNSVSIVGGIFATLKTSFGPITASTNYDWTGIPVGNYILSIRGAGVYHRTVVAAITAYDSADNSVTILTQSGYGAAITLTLVSVTSSTFTIRVNFANNMDATNLNLIRLQ